MKESWMSKAILDTDIVSELMRGRNQIVIQRKKAYWDLEGFYYLSTVTVMEIVKGLAKQQDESRIEAFLASLVSNHLIALDLKSSIIAGRILSGLEKAGRPIGTIDPIIAATAISHNLTLVTGNTNHYQWIRDLGFPLIIDNWRIPTDAT